MKFSAAKTTDIALVFEPIGNPNALKLRIGTIQGGQKHLCCVCDIKSTITTQFNFFIDWKHNGGFIIAKGRKLHNLSLVGDFLVKSWWQHTRVLELYHQFALDYTSLRPARNLERMIDSSHESWTNSQDISESAVWVVQGSSCSDLEVEWKAERHPGTEGKWLNWTQKE